jgi:Spy/CpxP family protein refolding chaperone
MKRAFTFVVAISALGALSAVSLAQTAGPSGSTGTLQTTPAKKHAPNFKMIFEGIKEVTPTLNLTKAEQDQIDALVKKTNDDITQIHKDTRGDKDARTTKMEDLGKSFEKDFKGILTADQLKDYNKAYKAFAKKWHEDHKKNAATTTTTTTPTPAPAPSSSSSSGH